MTAFKVKVAKLNVRTAPVEDFTDKSNVLSKLLNGAPFESINQQTNKLGLWHQDANLHWVWGGGLTLQDQAFGLVSQQAFEISNNIVQLSNAQEYLNKRFDGTNLISQIDYNLLLNVDASLKKNMGTGVKVAIMDTAISKDVGFKNKVIRPFDAVAAPSNHGTFIAGIIAGTGGVSGISTDVTLIEMPLYDSDGFIQNDETIKKYLEFITNSEDQIILNISQADVLQQFESDLRNLKNCVIVASAGINNDLQNQELFFPASLSNVISVGSVTKNFASINSNTSFNNQLNFLLPSLNYVSYTNTNQLEFEIDTSSFAAAIISSIIALIISDDQSVDLPVIKSKLSDLAQPYSDKSKIILLNPLIPSK